QLIRRWRGPTPVEPRDLAWSPDGDRIAVASLTGEPACWILETQTGRVLRPIRLPSSAELAWSPDGTTLATACNDRKIYLWDAATGARKATLEGHVNTGLRAAFHPAGTLLASTGFEGRTWLWDPVLGRPWLTLTSKGWPLEFSRDGRIVVAVDET